jgi:glycosyltransferase involved in cell wall biosynthesis
MNQYEFMRKGFDMLVECAKEMPEVKFILVGLNDEYLSRLKASGMQNIELYGKVTYDELISFYSRAKVYAQLSLFEGMPSTICEAMLCECIPVGSSANGIPDIIGDTGIVVEKKNALLIKSALREALDSSPEKGVLARQRIIEMFDIKKREKSILAICNDLLQDPGK